jgi:hypothetical protein
MEIIIIILAITAPVILCLITYFIISAIIYLFQEAKYVLAKAKRHIKNIILDIKWAKVRFDIAREWRKFK